MSQIRIISKLENISRIIQLIKWSNELICQSNKKVIAFCQSNLWKWSLGGDKTICNLTFIDVNSTAFLLCKLQYVYIPNGERVVVAAVGLVAGSVVLLSGGVVVPYTIVDTIKQNTATTGNDFMILVSFYKGL